MIELFKMLDGKYNRDARIKFTFVDREVCYLEYYRQSDTMAYTIAALI